MNHGLDGDEYWSLDSWSKIISEINYEIDPGAVIHKEEVKHHTKDNFLIFCSNPLKIGILMIVILK